MKIILYYCRKFLFLTVVLNMYLGISVFAQEQKTTQELLMSTNWEPQDFFYEGDYGYVRYTKTVAKCRIKCSGILGVFAVCPIITFDINGSIYFGYKMTCCHKSRRTG